MCRGYSVQFTFSDWQFVCKFIYSHMCQINSQHLLNSILVCLLSLMFYLHFKLSHFLLEYIMAFTSPAVCMNGFAK